MPILQRGARWSRRRFLKSIALTSGAAAGARACYASQGASEELVVMTVAGPVRASELGIVLPHEHVLVDFVGADRVSRERYDADEVVRVVLPHLQNLRELGGRTLVECTPAYLGRDPLLLRRLASASGLRMVTNTGYYGAAGNKYLPAHAWDESADELAARWVAEWRDGIEGTGVRPGFIKIGVDRGLLSPIHKKLVQAAARTHRQTGLTIAVHTGDGEAALDELRVLEEEGVRPEAWIWVHAQNERNDRRLIEVAQRGGWVEWDGVSPGSIERCRDVVMLFRREGCLARLLLSHDAGWYHVGEPEGGSFRPYSSMFLELKPALLGAGLSERELRILWVENPARALARRQRLSR